jgi:hypothetical protein
MTGLTTIRIYLLAALLLPLGAWADTSTLPIDVRAYDRCPAQTVSSPIPFTVPLGTDSVTLNYEIHGGIIPEGFLEYIGTEYDHQCVVNIPTLGVDRYTVTVVDPTGVELFTKTRPAQRTRYPVSCQFPYPDTFPNEVVESLSKKIDVSALTADGASTLTLTVSGCNTNGTVGYVGSSYIAAILTMVGQPVAYLDVNDSFDPENPKTDYNRFIPGSKLNGTSVPPEIMVSGGQIVKIHILSKPLAEGTYTLTLSDISRYPGAAMNYPLDGTANTLADLSLSDNSQTDALYLSAPIDPSGHTVIPLFVRDFAASGKLKIDYTRNATTRTIFDKRIPKDDNGNGMPDQGWDALANGSTSAMNHVADVQPAASDADNDPVVSGLPLEGTTGDGLSAAEEYRGFVVRGKHRRLHPLRKDLFVVVDASDDGLDDRLLELPLTLHEVRRANVVGNTAPVINPHRASVPGASLQRALRVRNRYPSPSWELDNGQVVAADFEALGFTFLQGDNINRIDSNMAALSLVQSPNETIVSDVFDAAFWRHYLSYGPNGRSDTAVAPTDIDDPTHLAIFGGNDWLQSAPNDLDGLNGDDFQTASRYTVCGQGNDRPWRVVTASEDIELYQSTFLHEAAHGLGIVHDRIQCSPSIMSDEATLPTTRPLTTNDLSQIRLHRKHN